MDKTQYFNYIASLKKKLVEVNQDLDMLESFIEHDKEPIISDWISLGTKPVNSTGNIYLKADYADKRVVIQLYDSNTFKLVKETSVNVYRAGYAYIGREYKNRVFIVKIKVI